MSTIAAPPSLLLLLASVQAAEGSPRAESADETGAYLVIVLVTVLLMVFVGLGLVLGWRNRNRRQADIPKPLPVTQEQLETEPIFAAEGVYVSTVRGADWLERVAVHGLGVRTDARIEVHQDGIVLLLDSAPNFFIPYSIMNDVFRSSGMAGKFVEKDGLLAISWNLGEHPVTTGLRLTRVPDQQRLIDEIKPHLNE